jgi:hypothetical protein
MENDEQHGAPPAATEYANGASSRASLGTAVNHFNRFLGELSEEALIQYCSGQTLGSRYFETMDKTKVTFNLLDRFGGYLTQPHNGATFAYESASRYLSAVYSRINHDTIAVLDETYPSGHDEKVCRVGSKGMQKNDRSSLCNGRDGSLGIGPLVYLVHSK